MAGDALRDAFRSQIDGIGGGLWTRVETLNAAANPDVSQAGVITLAFPDTPPEDMYTFGDPGANLWLETGQVFVDIMARLGTGTDIAETHARTIRDHFRNRRFAAGSRTVRIVSVSPLGGGEKRGAWWVETVILDYRVFNIG